MNTKSSHQLSNVDFWGNSLGLLPVNLSSTADDKYILLNGGTGDFCLQLNNQIQEPEYYNSAAWSSNTKNFIVFQGSELTIFNWRKNKIEPIKTDTIEKHFSNFYEYLVQNSFRSEFDIVPFIVNIFRQLRNLTNEKKNGVEALNLLFLLLTSLEVEDVTRIDTSEWGIKASHIPHGFENYIEQFKEGILGLKPNLELILRHSSGTLFQEAHKEAVFFNKQLGVFSNTLSGNYPVNKIMYSSIHYTPSYIARTIVENSLNKIDFKKQSLKIFDPACGSSEFLIEVLKQLKARNYSGDINITGWDSSESAISTSRFLLTYELREWAGKVKLEVKLVEDSIKENWDEDYDLIVMNPPFQSWEIMDKNEREYVKEILGSLSDGRPNQASAFFYKACQSIHNDGVIGCVLPSSMLSLEAYSKLRKKLQEGLNISLIGKLGNFVFQDALTDISILVAHKPNSGEPPVILWSTNEKGASSDALRQLRIFTKASLPYIDRKNYSIYKPISFPLTAQNWKPLSYQENELIKIIEAYVLEEKLVRVQDIFNVKQGIRTGNNSVFKIPVSIFDNLPNLEKTFFRPAIDNDAIDKGKIKIKNYVWYPYTESGLMLRSEEELQANVPSYYNMLLLPNKKKLVERARKNEDNWWTLSEHRDWLLRKYPKLVSTEFGKSDSFAFDKEGLFVIERGNGWIPKKKFKHLDAFYFYLAIFSSSFFDRLLSIYSKQLSMEMWYDLGNKFTKQIPIPSVFSNSIFGSAPYENLVEIGKQISFGSLFHFGILDEIVSQYFYSNNS